MSKFYAVLLSIFLASSAWGKSPNVVADIAPVHSLLARVMMGAGEPTLLVKAATSPHTNALRPSQAVVLERADIVVLTSFALTPWLATSLENLAPHAQVIELMQVQGAVHHDLRGSAEHSHEHDHSAEHGDELLDPHGWLDPENAKLWVQYLAETLSDADPDNAALYLGNALKAVNEMDALSIKIASDLTSLKSRPYMALHDGFQYFDRRFELTFVGAIALGDGAAPSPARIAHARETLQDDGVRCIFTEPQQSDRLVQVVVDGTASKIGQLDAIGAKLSPGPDLYVQLIQALADSFAACLAD